MSADKVTTFTESRLKGDCDASNQMKTDAEQVDLRYTKDGLLDIDELKAQPNKKMAGKLGSSVTAGKKYQCVDGCYALTDAVYRMVDTAFIFPITPASLMSEYADNWSASERKNMYDQVTSVTQMNSEAGAAGALHGALSVGSVCTTFTASQGLLLMIPNMYKIAGELLPCVIHVGARALAGQALSIYGDHSDVMSARSTGFSILSSFSVQEAHDFAILSHIATLETKVPILHFCDGFRTTHEIKKIHLVETETLRELVDDAGMEEFRKRGLNPLHPDQRGTAQGPDIFMQMMELANRSYDAVPMALQRVMDRFAEKTGRQYELFTYHGHEEAEHVIVIMGSGYEVVQDYIDHYGDKKIGVVGVHLYNPWHAESFLSKIPETCKTMAVLDKVKDAGSQGEPLFQQVATSLMSGMARTRPHLRKIELCGGRYGLGSKDFNPKHVDAILENLYLGEEM
jgi:pyruvate-ferredoxin/flavodoxin oxidoreductase